MNTTVLIPVYQPTDTLIALTEALSREGFHILIVDDGSGAAYAPIFSRLEPFAQILSYSENRGKGYALKHGMRRLLSDGTCDALITADADGQHSVRDICRVRDELEQGHSFVLTTRQLHQKGVPFLSRFGNTMSRFICALSGGCYLPDNQSGLRGFSADCLPWLCAIGGDKYDYEMNVLLYAERQELSIRCLPIEVIYLNDNKGSHFDPFRDTVRIYLRVIRTSRVSLLAAALHLLLIGVCSVCFGWNGSALTVPLCALVTMLLSYLGNRFLVFRGLHYACGPRVFLITAFRTLVRCGFCALFHGLTRLPLLAAWLLACILTVPAEYLFLLALGKRRSA